MTETPKRAARSAKVASFARRLDLHGVIVEISAPTALAPWLAVVLRAYPKAPVTREPDFRITVVRHEGMWRVIDDQSDRRTSPETWRAGIAARHVEWLVVSEALRRWTDFVHVHAALVATEDRSALLIGRSGSGKSTTSMALALAGLTLYTDDLALLDRATLRPFCLPRPAKLDRRSRRMLQPRGLVIPPGSSLGESIDRTVLPGLPSMNLPGPPLSAAIFFADERGDRAQLRPLTSAEAVMRLIQQSASERFDEQGPSPGAMAVINAVRCYELTAGDLDSTVRAVLDLLAVPDERVVFGDATRPTAAVA